VANSTATCPDFTWGTVNNNNVVMQNKKGVALVPISNVGNNPGYKANNAEIIALLRDSTNVIVNGNYNPNLAHSKNPEKHVFLNAKQVSDTRQPGVGPDGVYRDPWSNPYIISVDLNYDEKCRDAFHRRNQVNKGVGLNGLVQSGSAGSDNFEARAPVMVWSLGPDGMANPALSADVGVNRDNVLSWK
jgi:hypothetical protein